MEGMGGVQKSLRHRSGTDSGSFFADNHANRYAQLSTLIMRLHQKPMLKADIRRSQPQGLLHGTKAAFEKMVTRSTALLALSKNDLLGRLLPFVIPHLSQILDNLFGNKSPAACRLI